MKDTLNNIKSEIIKWTIIIIIAACAFYLVYPKYSFQLPSKGKPLYKANKITGTVEAYKWKRGGDHTSVKSPNSATIPKESDWKRVDLFADDGESQGQWQER